jgi:hypothetical protein
MEVSVKLIRQIDKLEPGLREILFAILEEIGRQRKERVTKDDFQELKQIVRELVQAQARTEARMEELAQAQARTEVRMEELTQAQARTEARMEELAQAQARTEKELQKLAKSHHQLQQQVGGLSDAVGYGIEDRLMPFISDFALLEFSLEVDLVERRNVEYGGGKYDEVNILASGHINGERCFLIAECKAKPGKRDADRFNGMLGRLSEILKGKFFPVFIGYTFAPEVEHYVAEKYPHIHLVKTYDVEMKARKLKNNNHLF